jgi:hypothetical protein
MRKRTRGLLWLSLGLVALSAVLYAGLYLTFGRLADIGFYTLLDLAFIPLQVVLVGLVIDRLLAEREKRALLEKLNMVIGAFFSEVGRDLLARLAAFDSEVERIRPHLLVTLGWTDRDFDAALAALTAAHPAIDILDGDPEALKAFLSAKRDFLLRLLENPNMLEHARFTDVLWAVTHLAEELSFRPGFDALPAADLAHLSLDMRRAYVALLCEWLEHMRHLKAAYPYLFSLAARTNPFDPAAEVEVSA